jgi:hypothetical protein
VEKRCFTSRQDLVDADGLRSFDATALTSLLVPMPSLTVIFSFWPMALRTVSAISTAGFRAPDKSK